MLNFGLPAPSCRWSARTRPPTTRMRWPCCGSCAPCRGWSICAFSRSITRPGGEPHARSGGRADPEGRRDQPARRSKSPSSGQTNPQFWLNPKIVSRGGANAPVYGSIPCRPEDPAGHRPAFDATPGRALNHCRRADRGRGVAFLGAAGGSIFSPPCRAVTAVWSDIRTVMERLRKDLRAAR